MIEKIGNVSLDLEFYRGNDRYSDGAIEDYLLELASSGRDIEEILKTEQRWAVLYHFSPERQNILDWYEFDREGSLLEIGSGCGALSGLFARKCKKVTAIELSHKRSSINANLNRHCDNLTIKVGNFEDIDLKGETFDYITLIGVFEYSINYINSKNPFTDMLRRAKSLLKPGGVLFIAIENKYGLKYFAGAKEDHCGRIFEGIEGYPNAKNVRTFSKKELELLIKEAGFNVEFYYPYPDYKLPRRIYSDRYQPRPGELSVECRNFDRDRLMLFDEQKAFDEIIRDGYFPDFSNSFLVLCN